MTALQFQKLLSKLEACHEAKVWAKGKDLKTVWETCDRGDWLLWLVGHMADKPNWPTHKQVALAACACAETSLKYVPKDELRPKQAIEITRRWVEGKAIIEEVRQAAWAAWAAAWAAEAADAAADEAADAVARAADAAAWAAWAAWAAEAAAWAAWAAGAVARAADAAAWAVEAARAASLKETADIVHQTIRPEIIYGPEVK